MSLLSLAGVYLLCTVHVAANEPMRKHQHVETYDINLDSGGGSPDHTAGRRNLGSDSDNDDNVGSGTRYQNVNAVPTSTPTAQKILLLLQDLVTTQDLDGDAFFHKWQSGKVCNYISIGADDEYKTKLPVRFDSHMDYITLSEGFKMPVSLYQTLSASSQVTTFDAMRDSACFGTACNKPDYSTIPFNDLISEKFAAYVQKHDEQVLRESFFRDIEKDFMKETSTSQFLHAYVDVDTSEEVSFVKSWGMFHLGNNAVEKVFRGCIVPFDTNATDIARLEAIQGVSLETFHANARHEDVIQNYADNIEATDYAQQSEQGSEWGKKTAFRYALVEIDQSATADVLLGEPLLQDCFAYAPGLEQLEPVSFLTESDESPLTSI